MELKLLLERKQGRLKSRRRRMRPPTASKRAEVWYRDRLTDFIDSMVQAFVDELGKPALTDATDSTPLSITTRLAAVMQRLASISIQEVAARLSAGFVAQGKPAKQRTDAAHFLPDFWDRPDRDARRWRDKTRNGKGGE